MPFQMPYFPAPQYDQTSGYAMQQGALNYQDVLAKSLMNQSQQAQLPYVGPEAQQSLLAAQLGNQRSEATLPYAGPEARAQVGLTGSQAAMMASEAAKNNLMVKNPSLMLGGNVGALLYMMQHPEMLNGATSGSTQGNAAVTGDTNTVTAAATPSAPNVVPTQGSSTPQSSQVVSSLLGQSTAPNMSIVPPNGLNTDNLQQVQSALTKNTPAADPTGRTTPENDMINQVQNMVFGPSRLQNALAQLRARQAQGYTFAQMPAQEKTQTLAQLAGAGYTYEQATQLLTGDGKNPPQTVDQLLQAKGFDPKGDLPQPIYPTTTGALTAIQKRNQSLAEIDKLTPIIANATVPYERTFAGYSPIQIMNALGNQNPDAQAQFAAAKAISPEMAALRTKAMGGNVSHAAIVEIQNAAIGQLKQFQGLMSPEVYQKSQQYLLNWIEQGGQAANKVGLSPGTYGNTPPTPVSPLKDTSQYTDENLAYTAQKNNMTVAQVKQKLGIQ